LILRLAWCTAAGTIAAGVMGACSLTVRRQALAAHAAAGHQSATSFVTAGSILAALMLTVVLFAVATAVSWSRAALAGRAARRGPRGGER